MKKSSSRAASFAAALALFCACAGGEKSAGTAENDSLATAATDTCIEAEMLCGFVGTETTMNTIQLVSASAGDTLWVELTDETIRNATLEAGRHVCAVVTRDADGVLSALLTQDATDDDE